MTHSQLQAWLDQEDANVAQTIRRHGVFIQSVFGAPDDLPVEFSYTVGLFGLGHPELVVLSAGMATASELLNHLSGLVRAGGDLVAGELLSFDDWTHRVTVEVLPNPGEILFAANRHYQRPAEASVPAYQLTYDDRHGAFPWDAAYVNDPILQPRPGTWRA